MLSENWQIRLTKKLASLMIFEKILQHGFPCQKDLFCLEKRSIAGQ